MRVKKMKTLSDKIYNGEALTDSEIDGIVSLFASRCKREKQLTLRRRLRHLDSLKNYGIFGRVYFPESGRDAVDYCCGQSWSDEIKLVRELLISG
jgi:hypothetical protein